MRIYSKFPDYYDSVKSCDKDDLIYLRNSSRARLKEVIKEKLIHKNEYLGDTTSKEMFKSIFVVGYRKMILGFCGKLYPVLEFHYNEKVEGKISSMIKRVHFYNQEDLDHFLFQKKIKIKVRKSFLNILDVYTEYFGKKNQYLDQHKDKILPLFSKLQVPIFLIRNEPDEKDWEESDYPSKPDIVLTNPCLKDISFQTVFDPFTTFQEISMYLGGVLTRPDRPMCQISDKVKVQQHGFDELSFRTLKGDKKPRKSNSGKKNI